MTEFETNLPRNIVKYIDNLEEENDKLTASNAALLEALKDMFNCIGKTGYFPQCGKTISDKARAAIKLAESE